MVSVSNDWFLPQKRLKAWSFTGDTILKAKKVILRYWFDNVESNAIVRLHKRKRVKIGLAKQILLQNTSDDFE